uniref:Uncharacterized protein n=1 Tax=Aegilops tauschii subsp. strangulata TaxID=200361 RepID=A0A453GTP3_AEGTS
LSFSSARSLPAPKRLQLQPLVVIITASSCSACAPPAFKARANPCCRHCCPPRLSVKQ